MHQKQTKNLKYTTYKDWLKFMFRCVYILHLINPLLGPKLGFFPRPFLISTSWLFILAEAFRNDHVAACSTALRSATQNNELGGYVTIQCSSEITQRFR